MVFSFLTRKNLGSLILSPCSNKGVINITVYYYFQFQLPYEARGAAVLVRILFSACQLTIWSPKTVWLTSIYKRKLFLSTHTCVFLKMCLYSEKWLSKNCILSLNRFIACLYLYPMYLVLKYIFTAFILSPQCLQKYERKSGFLFWLMHHKMISKMLSNSRTKCFFLNYSLANSEDNLFAQV